MTKPLPPSRTKYFDSFPIDVNSTKTLSETTGLGKFAIFLFHFKYSRNYHVCWVCSKIPSYKILLFALFHGSNVTFFYPFIAVWQKTINNSSPGFPRRTKKEIKSRLSKTEGQVHFRTTFRTTVHTTLKFKHWRRYAGSCTVVVNDLVT